jgi:hypothetical protein
VASVLFTLSQIGLGSDLAVTAENNDATDSFYKDSDYRLSGAELFSLRYPLSIGYNYRNNQIIQLM